MDDLYREIVLDHASSPRNFGKLEHPTHTIKATNASCGDAFEMQFLVEKGKIAEVGWHGVGCAISTASTSLLSELVLGKTVKEAKKITAKTMLAEMGLTKILPTREKCLALPVRILSNLEEK